MNRRQWLIATGAGAVCVACGSNHAKPDAAPDAASCSATSDPQIAFLTTCADLDPICVDNHGHAPHAVMVPGADVVAGVTMTYQVAGLANHVHMVTVTDAHFATLQVGGSVTIVTTAVTIAGNDHKHAIVVTCG